MTTKKQVHITKAVQWVKLQPRRKKSKYTVSKVIRWSDASPLWSPVDRIRIRKHTKYSALKGRDGRFGRHTYIIPECTFRWWDQTLHLIQRSLGSCEFASPSLAHDLFIRFCTAHPF